MRGLPRLFFAAVLAVALLSAAPALADDSAVGGTAGAVRPVPVGAVRMQAEAVQAVLYGGFAEYRVDFRFVNEGPERRVTLGFPFLDGNPDRDRPLTAFRAWANGEPLQVTRGTGKYEGEDVAYFLHQAVFPKGATTVTVSYLAMPTMYAGVPEDMPTTKAYLGMTGGTAVYEYWLHTGAGWKGRIDEAYVKLSPADTFYGWGLTQFLDKALKAKGGDYRPFNPTSVVTRKDGSWVWRLTGLEPTKADDIRLSYVSPDFRAWGGGKPSKDWAVSPLPSVTASTERSRVYPASAVADGDPGTGWTENAAGAGKGQWVKLTYRKDRAFRELRIVPGMAARDLFTTYGRPKTVKIEFPDKSSQVLRLADECRLQRFAVRGKGRWAKLTILDVYPGTASDVTAISEIELGAAPAPRFAAFGSLVRPLSSVPASEAPSSELTSSPGKDSEATATVRPVSTSNRRPDALAVYGERTLGLAALAMLGLGCLAVTTGVLIKESRSSAQSPI